MTSRWWRLRTEQPLSFLRLMCNSLFTKNEGDPFRLADYEGCLAHEQAIVAPALRSRVGHDEVNTCVKEVLS